MVTGSNYLVTTKKHQFIVDCGLFQGSKEEEEMNREPFHFHPHQVDFMILTHAHMDHSGRIPKLYREGFIGKTHCTYATKELSEIMLLDSANIQRADAEWENRKRMRAGKDPIEPLYDEDDVHMAMSFFEGHHYGDWVKIDDEIRFRFLDAGHILGSAMIEIHIHEEDKTVRLVFSGDLGTNKHALIRNHEIVEAADYLVLESTYGNSMHGEYEDSLEQLVQIIEHTAKQGGDVIIPSFAIGRTQELIYVLNMYYDHHRNHTSPVVPIYIDSPLAVKATKIFMKNTEILKDDAQELIKKGDNIFQFENLHYIQSVEESKSLNTNNVPKVIISASGMATGGRVRHHLKHNLWNPKNVVIFVGYQGAGTLGRILKDGAKRVKILGEEIAVRATMYSLPGFSAHADAGDLDEFLRGFKEFPKTVFLVHGEPEEMMPFKKRIEENYNTVVQTPVNYSSYTLSTKEIGKVEREDYDDISKEDLQKQYEDLLKMMKSLESDLEDMKDENKGDVNKTLKDMKRSAMNLAMQTGR